MALDSVGQALNFRKEGRRLQDLLQVLPELTRDQVQKLLGQLKKMGESISKEGPSLCDGILGVLILQLRRISRVKHQLAQYFGKNS